MPQLERWKDVVGYEGLYQVSDWGRVKGLATRIWFGNRWYQKSERILKRPIGSHGYPKVTLARNGEQEQCLVHRLVLEAFVGPCPNGMECRHADGNRINSCLKNLCWGTSQQNASDRRQHGTLNIGERNGNAKFSENLLEQLRTEYASGLSQAQLSRKYRISQPHVSRIMSGIRRSEVFSISKRS